MQLMARKALVDGLVRYDEAHGWHGTVKTIDIGQDWGVPLGDIPAIRRYQAVAPRRRARCRRHRARIGLQPSATNPASVGPSARRARSAADGMKWTGKARASAR